MATAQQILANRANASLSTGPRSAAGIEATKYNATKHGLSGKQIVTKGEDPAAFDELRLELIAEHAPASEREAMLVEEIAQNWWRLARARRVEAAVIQKFGELEVILEPDARKAFQTITRYLNAIQRAWNRASKDLDALQNKRKEEQEDQRQAIAFQEFAEQRRLTRRPTWQEDVAAFRSVSSPRESEPLTDAEKALRL